MLTLSNFVDWLKRQKSAANFFLLMWASGAMWLYSDALIIELPFFVPYLPEGWRLGSFIVLMKGVSTVFLLTLPLFLKPGIIVANLICFGIGVILSFTLIFVWDVTLPANKLFHEGLSIGFLVNAFLLLGLDSIRMTVVYMLADSLFADRYVTAILIGDTLGGLFATGLSYIQGYKIYFKNDASDPAIYNDGVLAMNGKSGHTPLSTDFVFGPQAALAIFCFIFFTSFVALCILLLINKDLVYKNTSRSSSKNEDFSSEERSKLLPDNEQASVENEALIHRSESDCEVRSYYFFSEFLQKIEPDNKYHMYYLFILWFLMITMCFGFMPSVFTYTTIPYSQRCFNLSVACWGLSFPLIAIVAHYTPVVSRLITLLTCLVIHLAICLVLIMIATQSPNPPLADSIWGEIGIICLWTLESSTGYFLYSKVYYRLSEMTVENAIKWGSIVAQMGALAGSVISFVSVNAVQAFHDE